jgi:hypothetical protein
MDSHLQPQKKTRNIYQRGGVLANSKFDYSALKPVKSQGGWDSTQLTPIVENSTLSQPEGWASKIPRDILIGLTHMGRNLHNLPHDLSKLAEWPVEKIAGPLKHPLSSYLPYDQESYADVFGQKGKGALLDRLIQGGVEHAPELLGGYGLVRGGLRRLTGRHHLDQVRRAAQEMPEAFAYPEEMLQQARRFLPQSQATDELIHATRQGGYNPAFSTQSQVGYHQRALQRSPLAAEQRRAPQAGDLKQNMLNHLESVFRNEGMDAEADLLRQGITNFRRYAQVRDAAMPLLKKYGIPTSILAAIGVAPKVIKKSLDD